MLNPSAYEEHTKTSLDFKYGYGFDLNPRSLTLSPTFFSTISLSNPLRSDPSPTRYNSTFGVSFINSANASIRRSNPFTFSKRPILIRRVISSDFGLPSNSNVFLSISFSSNALYTTCAGSSNFFSNASFTDFDTAITRSYLEYTSFSCSKFL